MNDTEWHDLNSQGMKKHYESNYLGHRHKTKKGRYVCSACGRVQNYKNFCINCHGMPHEMMTIEEEKI